MDPVYTLFWSFVLLMAGFLFSYIAGWHPGAAAAILTSFVLIGLAAGNAMGNTVPLEPLVGLMVGFGWGADEWRRARGLAVTD